MSRLGIFSDIHGNAEALKALFMDLDKQEVDRMICLGDLVEGDESNEEVIELIRGRTVEVVQGNHDTNNTLELKWDSQRYLAKLPKTIESGEMLFAHISPSKDQNAVKNVVDAEAVFCECKARLIFIGHLHYPIIYRQDPNSEARIHECQIQYNRAIKLNSKKRYLVCAGAVGYSRDYINKIRYAIYDDASETLEIRAIDGPLWDRLELFSRLLDNQ